MYRDDSARTASTALLVSLATRDPRYWAPFLVITWSSPESNWEEPMAIPVGDHWHIFKHLDKSWNPEEPQGKTNSLTQNQVAARSCWFESGQGHQYYFTRRMFFARRLS